MKNKKMKNPANINIDISMDEYYQNGHSIVKWHSNIWHTDTYERVYKNFDENIYTTKSFGITLIKIIL